MSRGGRGVILAIGFGLVALWSALFGAYSVALLWGDQRGQEQAQQADSAEKRRALTDTAYAPYPNLNEGACYQAKNHDTADLCAQWRAAVAAERAATAAEWAVWWTIAGTFLSSIALGSLLVTIQQGKTALKRARKANKIAQRIGEAQVRAYPLITKIEITVVHAVAMTIGTIHIDNKGQSPALNVRGETRIASYHINLTNFESHKSDIRGSIIAPGTPGRAEVLWESLIPLVEVVTTGEDFTTIRGRLIWTDVFGADHEINFRSDAKADIGERGIRFVFEEFVLPDTLEYECGQVPSSLGKRRKN